MLIERKQLEKKISELRFELNKVVNEYGLMSEVTLTASKRLDILITEYYQRFNDISSRKAAQ